MQERIDFYDGFAPGEAFCLPCGSQRLEYGPDKNPVFDTEWRNVLCTDCGYVFAVLTRVAWEELNGTL